MRDRRLLIALGAVLLVGGWGITRYAQQGWWIGLPIDDRQTTGWIFGAGVLTMTIGAGLIGFAVLPKR